MHNIPQNDLIILVADPTLKLAIEELCKRTKSIPSRDFSYEVYAHPNRDPGCRAKGVEFLSRFETRFRYALLVFDYEGCGAEAETCSVLKRRLDSELRAKRFGDKSRVILINPELEAWVWSSSSNVDKAMHWAGRTPALRDWLVEQGYITSPNEKPRRPKEAMEAALKEARVPFSSSIHKALAQKVGFNGCIDNSFNEFRSILSTWFPKQS